MTDLPKISKALLERAERVIPGGVNSPVRAFGSVGGSPLFIDRADGAYVFDVDGRKFIDYVGSWGPMILGHNARSIREAVSQVLERGTSFGAPTELEVELAEFVSSLIPNIEMLRLVNSGTEATMTAVRLARGYTGRDCVIKFNGCYHGHADSLLVAAGSGVATCGIAGSAGVPADVVKNTVSIEFNDISLLQKTVSELGGERVAAIIVEPIPGNMGMLQPDLDFLHEMRALCSREKIVLIFDEVMSGFRVSLGGAQERFGIAADLVTYGKVIGGGLPVGAFGGRRDIMSQLAPLGPVYQAGTLSGNPLAVAAGLAALQQLKARNPYPQLEERGEQLVHGLRVAAEEAGVAIQAANYGSMFGMFFSDKPVRNYEMAKQCDQERFVKYFHGMLAEGIYLAPSAFEAGFISTEHTEEIIDQTIASAKRVFQSLANA